MSKNKRDINKFRTTGSQPLNTGSFWDRFISPLLTRALAVALFALVLAIVVWATQSQVTDIGIWGPGGEKLVKTVTCVVDVRGANYGDSTTLEGCTTLNATHILIRNGTVSITKSIELRSKQIIEGESQDAILKMPTNAGFWMVNTSNVDTVGFKNIKLLGSSPNNIGDLRLQFENVSNLIFQDVWYDLGYNFVCINCTYVTVSNYKCTDSYGNCGFFRGVKYATINGFQALRPADDGFCFEGSVSAVKYNEDISFTNWVVDKGGVASGDCIKIHGKSKAITVSNGVCDGGRTAGINIYEEDGNYTSHLGSYHTPSEIMIEGNIIRNMVGFGISVATLNNGGTQQQASSGNLTVTIRNNDIGFSNTSATGSYGIYIRKQRGLVIQNNYIHNITPEDCIRLNNVTYSLVSGNMLYQCQGHGIEEAENSDYNQITGNYLDNEALAVIGTNTVRAHNWNSPYHSGFTLDSDVNANAKKIDNVTGGTTTQMTHKDGTIYNATINLSRIVWQNPTSDATLMLYLPFSSTVVQDFSGNGKSCVGQTGTAYTPSGYYGSAYSFNGAAGNIINCTDGLSEMGVADQSTIMAWVYAKEYTGGRCVFGDTTATATKGYVYIAATGKIRVYRNTTYFDEAGTSLLTNTWQHLAISYLNATNANVYVNGNLVASGTGLGAQDPTTFLMVGGYGSGAFPWNGTIDDFRVYNKTMTQDEILRIYSEGTELYGGNSFVRRSAVAWCSGNCNAGDVGWNTTHLCLCTTANTWKTAVLS